MKSEPVNMSLPGKDKHSVYIAIIYTEGQMSKNDIQEECISGNFSPVFTYLKDGKRWMPLMVDDKVATDFVKRNIPKDQVWGLLGLRYDELKIVEEQDIMIDFLDWPKKIATRKDVVSEAFPLLLPVTPIVQT